ncbi:hypothetical protein G3M48_002485 [Beauveria asiatica]|uniref:Uncharacterized protein n=1 Tax=Beauveria asiatica TaxID=1069075 RepID=A0AAW0RF76_9HYPO
MSLMIRIPSQNTNRHTEKYAASSGSDLEEGESWQPEQDARRARQSRRFSWAGSGMSLRRRFQAFARQLRKSRPSSPLRPESSSGQLKKKRQPGPPVGDEQDSSNLPARAWQDMSQEQAYANS